MRALLRGLANESVLLGALVSAVCVALDLPEKWMNVALAAVPLLLAVLVRAVVSSPATVAQVAVDAVAGVVPATVGAVGQVTQAGAQVAETVVESVGGLAGALAGPLVSGLTPKRG